MKANCMCLMIIQRSMSDVICGGIAESHNARRFLDVIGQKLKNPPKLKKNLNE